MSGGNLRAVILAAGKGTRLKSELSKVLHPLFGKPLLLRVLDTLGKLDASEACVIMGHGREQVTEALNVYQTAQAVSSKITSVVQEPQLGTGHALLQVRQKLADWAKYDGNVLIL